MTRRSMKNFEIALDPKKPCPCGDKKILQDCCLYQGNRIRKIPPLLLPPAPKTFFSNKNCYLHQTNDCAKKNSSEHYMSKAILETMHNVEIQGAPWLKKGEKRIVGINSLTANILCSRHNSCLSPLDAEAAKFFKHLLEIYKNNERKLVIKKRTLKIISGETIELWMLKSICGLFYSKNAVTTDKKILFHDHHIRENIIQNAFIYHQWQSESCGLYIKAHIGNNINPEHAISVNPLTTEEKTLAGAKFLMAGLEFIILIDTKGINIQEFQREGFIHRPTELLFTTKNQAHSIALTWLTNENSKCIHIEKGLSKIKAN